MAKGLRSKVKKRLRTVKRGVVKRELADPSSKLGVRNTAIHKKLEEALSGYLKPEVRARNAFRYDDADAVVPQHNWRQGPDFRSDRVGKTWLAVEADTVAEWCAQDSAPEEVRSGSRL